MNFDTVVVVAADGEGRGTRAGIGEPVNPWLRRAPRRSYIIRRGKSQSFSKISGAFLIFLDNIIVYTSTAVCLFILYRIMPRFRLAAAGQYSSAISIRSYAGRGCCARDYFITPGPRVTVGKPPRCSLFARYNNVTIRPPRTGPARRISFILYAISGRLRGARLKQIAAICA